MHACYPTPWLVVLTKIKYAWRASRLGHECRASRLGHECPMIALLTWLVSIIPRKQFHQIMDHGSHFPVTHTCMLWSKQNKTPHLTGVCKKTKPCHDFTWSSHGTRDSPRAMALDACFESDDASAAAPHLMHALACTSTELTCLADKAMVDPQLLWASLQSTQRLHSPFFNPCLGLDPEIKPILRFHKCWVDAMHTSAGFE